MTYASNWKHVSASQLKTFSACPKKWAWSYLFDFRGPETEPLHFGKIFHHMAEVASNSCRTLIMLDHYADYLDQVALGHEKYPLGGVQREISVPIKDRWIRSAARLVSTGIKNGYILFKQPELYIEIAIADEDPISLAGIEVKGFIDALDLTPGQETVYDHKTTSSWRWALSPMDLENDIQMNLYAAWVFIHLPELESVRLVHNQFNKKTHEARRAETHVNREDVERRLEQYTAVVEEMKALRDEAVENSHTDPGFIDVSHRIGDSNGPCGDYGGCFALAKCSAFKYSADEPFKSFGEQSTSNQQGKKMSSLADLMKKFSSDDTAVAPPATAAAPPAPPAPEEELSFFDTTEEEESILPPEAPDNVEPTPVENKAFDVAWVSTVDGFGAKGSKSIVDFLNDNMVHTYGELKAYSDEEGLQTLPGVGDKGKKELERALNEELMLAEMLDVDELVLAGSTPFKGNRAHHTPKTPVDEPKVKVPTGWEGAAEGPHEGPSVLLISCNITGLKTVECRNLLTGYMAVVEEELEVDSYLFPDYREGIQALAVLVKHNIELFAIPGQALYIDKQSPWAPEVIDILTPYFNMVVR